MKKFIDAHLEDHGVVHYSQWKKYLEDKDSWEEDHKTPMYVYANDGRTWVAVPRLGELIEASDAQKERVASIKKETIEAQAKWVAAVQADSSVLEKLVPYLRKDIAELAGIPLTCWYA
jgi:hypothetical protein